MTNKDRHYNLRGTLLALGAALSVAGIAGQMVFESRAEAAFDYAFEPQVALEKERDRTVADAPQDQRSALIVAYNERLEKLAVNRDGYKRFMQERNRAKVANILFLLGVVTVGAGLGVRRKGPPDLPNAP